MEVVSSDVVARAILNPLEDQSCSLFHAGSCNEKALKQLMIGSKSVCNMYLVVHLLPFFLFKLKNTLKNPVGETRKLVIGFIKSIIFAGGYSAIVRRTMCFVATHDHMRGYSTALGALFGSVTLLFEPVGRQSEIALYCLNKTMEVSYNLASRRNYPVRLPRGESILLGLALGIILYHYLNNNNTVRGNYRRFMDKLLEAI